MVHAANIFKPTQTGVRKIDFLRYKIIGAPTKFKTGRVPYLGLELTRHSSKAKSISWDSPFKTPFYFEPLRPRLGSKRAKSADMRNFYCMQKFEMGIVNASLMLISNPFEKKCMKLAKKPFWVGNSSTEEKSSFEPWSYIPWCYIKWRLALGNWTRKFVVVRRERGRVEYLIKFW